MIQRPGRLDKSGEQGLKVLRRQASRLLPSQLSIMTRASPEQRRESAKKSSVANGWRLSIELDVLEDVARVVDQ